jgi:hypothetical protein
MAYSTILERFRTCNAEVRNESFSAWVAFALWGKPEQSGTGYFFARFS